MQDPKFIHLRVHTAYSLSSGTIQVPVLMKKLCEQNVPAVAMTDTANMFGGKAFSSYASSSGIKPILGCQFYLRNSDADDLLKTKGKVVERDKLVLLVMNETGYKNISKLMKRFYLDNTQNGDDPQLKYTDLEE